MAVALIALIYVVRIAEMLPSRTFSYDFNHYYVTSRLLLDGQNPYRTPLASESEKYGFEHTKMIPVATSTPLSLWLLTPLAMLLPRPAFWIWVGMEAISLGAIFWLTKRLLQGQLTPRGWRFLCAGFLCSSPLLLHFMYSPEDLMLGAVFLAAYAWHKNGHDNRACWAVMLAGLVKVYPLIILPWFVWRSKGPAWKRLRNAAVLLLGAGAITLVTGLSMWMDWVHIAIPIIRWWSVGHTFNFTLPSFIINLGQVLQSGTASVQPSGWWWAAGGGVALFAILAVYAYCTRIKGDEDLQFALVCVGMLLVYARAYYYVHLIFPVGLAAARLSASISWRRTLLFAALLIAMDSQGPWDKSFWGGSPLVMTLLNYVPLYGLSGFCFFLARERRRE